MSHKIKKLTISQIKWLAENLDSKQLQYLIETGNRIKGDPKHVNEAVAVDSSIQQSQQSPDAANSQLVQNQSNNEIANPNVSYGEKLNKLCKAFGQGKFDVKLKAETAKKFTDNFLHELNVNMKTFISLIADLLQQLIYYPETATKHLQGVWNAFAMLAAYKMNTGNGIRTDMQAVGTNINELPGQIKQQNENLIYKAATNALKNTNVNKLRHILLLTESYKNSADMKSASNNIRNAIFEKDMNSRIKYYFDLNSRIKKLYRIYESEHYNMNPVKDMLRKYDNKNVHMNECISALKYSIRKYGSKIKEEDL